MEQDSTYFSSLDRAIDGHTFFHNTVLGLWL